MYVCMYVLRRCAQLRGKEEWGPVCMPARPGGTVGRHCRAAGDESWTRLCRAVPSGKGEVVQNPQNKCPFIKSHFPRGGANMYSSTYERVHVRTCTMVLEYVLEYALEYNYNILKST